MECNRDEAVRARDIAEQKYAKQDFMGAKKFVLKAQQLFPTLEGLNQMMPVMEVHSVAQIKVGGNEMDWYGILQVEPSADDGSVKKQYRKLALALHPDKNKSVGAEAAFKLIGEAWGILSDKTKRAVHDLRRGVKTKGSHVRVVMEPNAQAFHSVPTAAPTHNQPQHHHHSSGTFWTSCPTCKMQYQYLRTYENFQLQCPKCKEVFMARDIHSAAAGNGTGVHGHGWPPPYEPQRHEFSFNKPPATGPYNGATAANGFMNGGLGPFPSTYPAQASSASFFSNAAAAAAAQSKVAAAAAAAAAAPSGAPPNNLAADVVNQTYHKVKRERVEAEKEIKRKEKEMRRKEKEDLRKEKDEQRRSRDAERSRDAMDRLMAKRKENVARGETHRRVDVKRKLKRKKQEEDEELEEEDPKLFEHGLQDDMSSPTLPRRRSSRTKKSVATYKVDVSDDSDLEEFPASKRTKSEGDTDADGSEKSEKSGEENGREPGRQQGENGGKGKAVADDSSNHEKRSSGMNGGEDLDGERVRRSASERNKDSQGGAAKKDSHITDYMEPSRKSEGVARDSRVSESPRDSQKMKSRKPSQQVESPSPEKEMGYAANQDGGNVSKSEDFRDEKSPSKSPRTLRIRIKSPKVPYCPPTVEKEEDGRQQQRGSSPTLSAGSIFSIGPEEHEIEDVKDQIDVPDPDFHDFDSVRTEKDILQGQIWAIYDDQDGMPRFYGRIAKVVPKPFKASINWLELYPTLEKSEPWTDGTGLSVTCGEFKIGQSHVMDQINTFSHIVVDNQKGKGLVKIYPKKDQVWAIYRDFEPEQRSGPGRMPKLHGEGSTYSYDMVDILTDFSEERGVKTVKLVKVRGYKTMFQRLDGQDAVRTFKLSEVQTFSHSVPVQRMDDREADSMGIPRGSLELDPASTPMDLIMDPSDHSR